MFASGLQLSVLLSFFSPSILVNTPPLGSPVHGVLIDAATVFSPPLRFVASRFRAGGPRALRDIALVVIADEKRRNGGGGGGVTLFAPRRRRVERTGTAGEPNGAAVPAGWIPVRFPSIPHPPRLITSSFLFFWCPAARLPADGAPPAALDRPGPELPAA
jgi:hypothetical protein